jgi:parallel beta-helix repeat protein
MMAAVLLCWIHPAAGANLIPRDCLPEDAVACLQSVINGAASGDTVVVPAGTWTLKSPIELRAQVTLTGMGGLTILQASPANDAEPLLLHGANLDAVTVSGITFDGNSQHVRNNHQMILIENSRGVLFDHVTVQHGRGQGLVIVGYGSGGSTGNGVQFSRFLDLGDAWKMKGANNSAEAGNTDRNVGLIFWGEHILHNKGNYALFNVFDDIGRDAMQATKEDSFVAQGNRIGTTVKVQDRPFDAGIYVEYSTNSKFIGNVIQGAAGNGIEARGMTGALITDNTISGGDLDGIQLRSSNPKDAPYATDADQETSMDLSDIVIEGNSIINNGNAVNAPASIARSGISISYAKASRVTFGNNTITDLRKKGKKTQRYGIEVLNDPKLGVFATASELTIDDDNKLDGNALGPTFGL